MEGTERKALQSFIDLRIDAAISRLRGNLRYLEVCEKQEETGVRIEELYQRFEKDDRLFIRRYYEDETLKTGLEFDEIYFQGLKDGISILKFLGVFSQEVTL
jgi:hypothetical protein